MDQLFYGGWYDYPAVVETVSDALAGSLQRHQLSAVLTQQVPQLMHLKQARLWIGEPGATPSSGAHSLQRSFPLRFRGRVRGLWTVGPREDGDPFSATDNRILETLARQADIALSNVLLVKALQDQLEQIHASQEILTGTQRRLLHSREEERARLARELHDGPIQMLVGLKLELGLLADTNGAARDDIGEALADARCEVQDLLSALRRICAQLRPPILDTLGLNAAIEALADDWSAEWGVPVEVEVGSDSALQSLDDEVAVNLYRIVQEALSNVARHAEAERVAMCLAQEDRSLILTVTDDGRGFVVPDDFGDLTAAGHFGLAGIGERVHLVGGSWSVASAPGQGTMLRVVWQDDRPASS
jgi:signal transduction histidine kinase